jgi:hypothetical protein
MSTHENTGTGLDPAAVRAVLVAAQRARSTYPGPVGEFLARELSGYIHIGRAVPTTGLIPRVVAELAAPSDRDGTRSAPRSWTSS